LTLPLQYQALNISSQLNAAGISSLSELQSELAAGTLSQTALASLGGLLQQLQTQNQGIVTFGGGRTQELVLLPALTASLTDQRNRARILEHISLRAVTGTDASYHDGLRYPIVSTTFSTLVNPNLLNQLVGNQQLTIPPPAVEYVDLGISLKVTPIIQSNRDITLKFEMKVQNLTGASVNQVPVIGNREFVGQMTLRQGESALIAGLTEETDLRSSLGIPGLSSVGAAALGGSVNRNKQQNEILITVTPRTIRMPQRPPMAFPTE
jgi:type II secretory pathway component GspD/PulD (secretin)